MTHLSKIKAPMFPLLGIVALAWAGPASAQAEGEDDTYCDSVDVHSERSDCALSTVCGKVQEHFPKPFTGNFSEYFSVRYLPDSTCEILAYRKQVLYKCINPGGEKFLGEIDYAGYPKPGEAHRHEAVCKSLLSRHLEDSGCEDSDDGTKPGCDEPKGEEPKKPEGEPKKEPGEEEPSTEPDTQPSTEPGGSGQDRGKLHKTCESAYGRCMVSSQSRPAQADGTPAFSQVSVDCQSQGGVQWGYIDKTPKFELVREEQLQALCGQELALCVEPLRGGQAQFFGLSHHPERKSVAQCSTSSGRCRVDADANGHGFVDCQCFVPGASAPRGMVYGMELGVKGAQAQCFLEVQRCSVKQQLCPRGGCDKKGRARGPGAGSGCAINAGVGSGKGPNPEDRLWMAMLALLGLSRLRRSPG